MQTQPELFAPLETPDLAGEELGRPPVGYWSDVWRRLKQNKLAMSGLALIIVLALMAVVGPYLSGHGYAEQNLSLTNLPPNGSYWFGTDSLGRDLFTRVWIGARISLTIGVVTSVICLVIGVLYGGLSGYLGGRVDDVMMRIVEVLYGIPFMLYVILLMVLMQPGLKTILIALGVTYWLDMARIVRGQVLSLKEQEYVLAARTLGAGTWRILTRHLIPNTMGPIIVTMTLLIPNAIFTEAFLSFLGLGVSAPMASWGSLANDGIQGLSSYPWELFFPALFISLTMLAFNFLGDGLRDALDPRLRR
ncbi:ABC transporter permease [Desulfotomaculum copahuensis]|uniref:Diguanylate cyclase n=1 Tax=Desulfotomaculum copahuensis TaxID=1838280 RepID=A0A1B7LEU6_9FIRM|nr:ABC transporter permease [Desulfotomaculum copahuensis]OAT81804.1 diguanylate cyclase [Desulfotomaculum copahuensis]